MSWFIQDKGCSIKIFDLVGEVHITKQRGKIVRGKGTTMVDGEVACEAVITFALDE